MPERVYSSDTYRYGFNNQEKDDEFKGSNESYCLKFRMYDSRLGRFLSVDRIANSYPWNSTYAFAENDVIRAIDLEGLEKYIITARSFIPMQTLKNPWYSPNLKAHSFAGDNRQFYSVNDASFRTEQKVVADFDAPKVYYTSNKASGSIGYDKSGNVVESSTPDVAGTIRNTPLTEKSSEVTIYLKVDASNKLVTGAPAINYDLAISISPNVGPDGNPIVDENGNQIFNYQVSGRTDGFPAYELWLTDAKSGNSFLLFNRTPTENGETPLALFPPMEHLYKLHGNSQDVKPATTINFNDTCNSDECESDCE